MVNSMQIISEELKANLIEPQIMFVPDCIIPNFDSLIENEQLPEGNCFILENLNFKPQEHGYVEPEKPKEDPLKKQKEEEAKRLEEEAKAAASKKPPSKMTAAEKKKEEELKKKLEEEEAKRRLENTLTEEQKAEIERQREEEERLRYEREYFDFRTIHEFKETLGHYGYIYVFDAPDASLGTSNTVAEIKCANKIMGLRVTKELRSLARFFLKKHPYDIKGQHYSPPPMQPYY